MRLRVGDPRQLTVSPVAFATISTLFRDRQFVLTFALDDVDALGVSCDRLLDIGSRE